MTEKDLVTEEKLRQLSPSTPPNAYKVGIGADAIRELLRKIDINAKWDEIKAKAKVSTSAAMKKKFAKQLKVIEAFRKSGNKPEWMIMDVIPVLPPNCVRSFRWTAAASPPRIERSVSACHQPEQPVEAPDGVEGARRDHP